MLAVSARGTDGAVWLRYGGLPRTWGPWWNFGGRLLAGTGPAVDLVGDSLYVAAVGTGHTLWMSILGFDWQGTGWHSLGGRTMSSPAITIGAGVAFVRGTDNATWYKELSGHPAGWHSLGGRLTSGVTALTQQEAGQSGPTSVFALGGDNRAWMRTGTWPALGGWQLVPVG